MNLTNLRRRGMALFMLLALTAGLFVPAWAAESKAQAPELAMWSPTDVQVKAVEGQEYAIAPKGADPDWTKAVEPKDGFVTFEDLTPATAYVIYTRMKGETADPQTKEHTTELSAIGVHSEKDYIPGAEIIGDIEPEDTKGLTYQWYYDTITENEEGLEVHDMTAIGGATASTYTVKEADLGKYLAFKAFRDGVEVGCCDSLGPVSSEAIQAANALHDLGLFQGVGTNPDGTPDYDLERAPNRFEAVTMLVRLLGKEDEAKAGTWTTPFTDLADWAKPYVGYAYANKLTNGISDRAFGGTATVTASQYLTFVLRALGYESGKDFQWDKAWELSDKLGFTKGQYNASSSFTRGDVAIVSNNALSAKLKDGNYTLKETLDGKTETSPKGSDSQQASSDASAYAYTVSQDFSAVKNEYSSATLVRGYVCIFTDLKGHQCVLTDVEYKIVSTYHRLTLRDLTSGEIIREPKDYYQKKASYYYGQSKLDFMQMAIDVTGHQLNMWKGAEGIIVNP